jgi:hypothetical protein
MNDQSNPFHAVPTTYAIQFLLIQTIYLILREPIVYRINREFGKSLAGNIESRGRDRDRRNNWKCLKNHRKYQKNWKSTNGKILLSFSWKFGRYRDEDYKGTNTNHDKRVKKGEKAATIRWNLYILILLTILIKAAVIEKNKEIDR